MNTWIKQCQAETLRVLRNPYFVFWSLAMPIFFYFIFTKVINTNVPNEAMWQAHYLMSMTAFSVMGSAIMTLGIRLVQERSLGWSAYMRITPLPNTIYFLAQMAGQTLIHLLSIIVIFTAGALINDISLTLWQWIGSGLWILFGSFPFLALGILFGAMRKVETAAGVSNVLYIALALCGGLWMPLDVMPETMQKIAEWLPSYHYGSGAWELIRGDAPSWKNVLILLSYFLLFMILSSYTRRKQEAM
ncbi:ABC transporter permease [Bacillus xiapuensis]|uniref:ABC transporter permease n=1 Tax=Bacillus xiapuensis TaxID=2014075 RepID=UPI000C232EAC|nr:ABC transporter permease [Bacillus xiapuensis]